MTLRWCLHGARERHAACDAIMRAEPLWRVELHEPKRTDAQNALMWARIGDIMKQRPGWFGEAMTAEDVKQVFLTALFREMRMARAADGNGFVPLARKSSALSYRQMGDLLDLIDAWAAREGVVWTKEERVQ
jgi:NinB protein